MAYAMLAGLPPEFGLRAATLPLLAFAMLGGVAVVALGPTALSAALFGAGIVSLLQDGLGLPQAVFALTAAVGTLQIVVALLRGGFLVNFLSAPVVNGFATAAGTVIFVGQLFPFFALPKPVTGASLFERIVVLVSRIGDLSMASVLLGAVVIVLVLLGPRWRARLPWPFLGLVVATVVAAILDLPVATVGEVVSVWPVPTAFLPGWSDVGTALAGAAPIVLIGFLELMTVQQRYDPCRTNVEGRATRTFSALGGANLAAALGGGMVVGSGLSRSAFFVFSGARTRWATVFTGLSVLFLSLLAVPVLQRLPVVALAALIIVAAVSLIDLRYLSWLWRVRRGDAVLWLITAAATLVLGVQIGILAGIGASLLWFIVRTTHPHTAVLGRLPGTRDYRNIRNHPDAETFPGILLLRMDAQFYFGNVSFLRDRLEAELRAADEPIHTVVIEAASMNQLDATAAAALLELVQEFNGRGVELAFANVKRPVRDVMDKAGITNAIGAERIYLNVEDAVRDALQRMGERGT